MAANEVNLESLLRALRKLSISLPASSEKAAIPNKFVNAIKNSVPENYISNNLYVSESQNIKNDLSKFRLSLDKFQQEVVSVCDKIFHITESNLNSANDMKNAWKHIWDPKRMAINPKKVQAGLKLIIKSYEWDILDWYDFVLSELKSVETLPDWIKDRNTLMTRVAQFSVTENAVESTRDEIEKGLEAMSWKDYVEVDDRDTKSPAKRELVSLLESFNVVEINGIGGLGKTELLYQFLRSQLKGEYDDSFEQGFEHYVILTAKSEQQGEIDSEITPKDNARLAKASPRDAKRGPRMYIPRLEFNDVVRIINTFDLECENLSDVENAKKVFNESRMLLALDNFEDCSESDVELFREFFRDKLINRAPHSKVVITGRNKRFKTVARIVLDVLPAEYSALLFKKRYIYLYSRAQRALMEIDWKGRSTILDGLNQANFPERFKDFCDRNEFSQFRDYMGHPLFIFQMTSLLGNERLIKKHLMKKDNSDIISLISRFVQDEDLELNKHHDELYDWMISKAFEDIRTDEVCMFILSELMIKTALTFRELKDAISKKGWNQLTDFERAKEKLLNHEIFVTESKIDNKDSLIIKGDGARFLNKQERFSLEILAQEPDEGTKVSIELFEGFEEIYHELSSTSSFPESLLDKMTKELHKTPLENRINLNIRVFEIISHISRRMSTRTESYGWSSIHNQAFEALLKCLQKNKYPDGAGRPRVLRILMTLLTDSEFTTNETVWKMLTSKNSVTWYNRPATQDGKSELIRHKLIKLLYDANRDLRDWLIWSAFYNKLVTNKPLLNSWKRYKKNITTDLQELKIIIENERKVKYIFSEAAKLIERNAVYDKEWDNLSFKLLEIFDTFPIEESWENLSSWKRYTMPPAVPDDEYVMKHLGDWNHPRGLSFNFLNTSGPEFIYVDEYETWPEKYVKGGERLNGDMDDFSPNYLDELEVFVLEWLSEKTAKRFTLNGIDADLQKHISPRKGINKYLRSVSEHLYPDLKTWILNYLIMSEGFISKYLYEPNAGLGDVIVKDYVISDFKQTSKVVENVTENKQEICDLFHDRVPGFPDIEPTIRVVLLFCDYLNSQDEFSYKAVENGKHFRDSVKKHNLSYNENTIAFGLGYSIQKLTYQKKITARSIVKIIGDTGEKRINESDEDGKKISLRKYMVEYLGTLEDELNKLNLQIKIPRIHQVNWTIGTEMNLLDTKNHRKKNSKKGKKAPSPYRKKKD